MGFKRAAILILEKSKKPLHSKKITRLALKRKLIKTEGETPSATMNAILLTDIERRGSRSKFIQTGPSAFGLRAKHKRSKKKAKAHTKGALIKGMAKNLPSEILTDLVFKKKLAELLRGYAGIYALYKDSNLYYVGLARSLHGRVRWHLRDRHAGKWNNFRVFLIQKVRYLKDIETLVLNIAEPKGNKTRGKLLKGADLSRTLLEVLKEHQRKIKALRRALK